MFFLLESCSTYTFSGASLPANAKSIYVAFIENKSSNAPATLNIDFSNALKDQLIQESGLDLVDGNETDLNFSGYITNYVITEKAPTANETTALNSLKIEVFITYKNKLNPKDKWQHTFSRFVNFDSSSDFNSIESELIDDILEQLVTDIFNKAFAQW